jgi:rhodanese-related sulfurtransferase
MLMEKGYTKVYALKGGWEEWNKAGYPTEKK